MNKDDELNEAISISPLLSMTPWMVELFERWGERTSQHKRNKEAQTPPIEVEVNQTSSQKSTAVAGAPGEQRPFNDEEAQSKKPVVPSTRLYTSLDYDDNNVILLSGYKAGNLYKVRFADRKLALEVQKNMVEKVYNHRECRIVLWWRPRE